jgi:hypothetical protein
MMTVSGHTALQSQALGSTHRQIPPIQHRRTPTADGATYVMTRNC